MYVFFVLTAFGLIANSFNTMKALDMNKGKYSEQKTRMYYSCRGNTFVCERCRCSDRITPIATHAVNAVWLGEVGCDRLLLETWKRTKCEDWLKPVHMLEDMDLLSCVISQNNATEMMNRALLNACIDRS